MSRTFSCQDREALADYLYGELDHADRARVEDHLRACPACAAELAGLEEVRRALAAWAPPAAEPNVSVAAGEAPARPPLPGWRHAVWPVWTQAAAAVLVVSAGLSMLNLRIHRSEQGLTITTGWLAAPAAPAAPVAGAGDPSWRHELATVERTLRDEIAAARADAVRSSVTAPRPDLTAERVAALIAESERRQRRELALRLTQFGRDLEVQRRSDLVRINQGLGQFEGRAGAEIRRQRQMLDYIMRASASAPPPQ